MTLPSNLRFLIAAGVLAMMAIGANLLLHADFKASGRDNTTAQRGHAEADGAQGASSDDKVSIVPSPAYSYSELGIVSSGTVVFSASSPTALGQQAGASQPDAATRTTWTVNEKDVAEGLRLTPNWFKRGDVVAVRVEQVDSEGAAQVVARARTTIVNAPPVLSSIELHGVRGRSDQVQAFAEAADPDHDTVSINYAWFVGGRAINGVDGPILTNPGVERGDAITVTATATDGMTTSRSLTSAPWSLKNHPPTIVTGQTSMQQRDDGSPVVTCALDISDPDGDEVEVDLPNAPDDVRWDSASRALVWTPENGARQLSVTVRVRDGKGAEVQRELHLSL